jgi:hypothetical protein
VTQDSEGSEGSLEYLVFTKVFIAIAGCFGLVPVSSPAVCCLQGHCLLMALARSTSQGCSAQALW